MPGRDTRRLLICLRQALPAECGSPSPSVLTGLAEPLLTSDFVELAKIAPYHDADS
jgi:hypothetical protein